MSRYASRISRSARSAIARSSYLSCSDPRLLFGLARATEAHVEVTWPAGHTQRFGGLLADRTVLITEGRDEVLVLP